MSHVVKYNSIHWEVCFGDIQVDEAQPCRETYVAGAKRAGETGMRVQSVHVR